MAERLEDLLRACTVQVLGGPMPGAGFFVAPGRVVTCVHVIGDSPALTVRWERDGQALVEVPVAGRVLVLAGGGRPIPALDRDYPDVAVLEVAGLGGHPCVGIDAEWPSHEDGFQVFGYPREGGAVQLTAARLTYRGTKGVVPASYLDLASDTVKPGMSGAAVLNLRSGAVCGVIVASKHLAQPDGALAIPWSAIDTDLTDVLAANRAFHLQDRRWNAAVAAARAAGAAVAGQAARPRARPLGPPAGARVVGERVSAAVDVFRDRVERRDQLRSLVLAREKPIICVTGRRGIGKSGLVARVLADFEEPADTTQDQVGGLAYLSTRTGVGRLDVARIFHALTGLLPQDQGDRLEKAWANARADVLPDLLTALRARNTVVVLDNLDDLQDRETGELTDRGVINFLTAICRGPRPPIVITTSQHPIELPLELSGHFTLLEIDDGLEAHEAAEFLRQLDAANRAGLRDLPEAELLQAAERVYRMPRGLELLVALMARRTTVTLRRLLATQDTPEKLLGGLVSEGFDGLDEAGRDVVRLFALAGTPLPAEALPKMLAPEHRPDAVARTVERLAETHVIGFDRDTGSARLHPIDSDYVRSTLDDPGKRATLDLRLADWLATQRTDPKTWRTSSDVAPQRREIRHRLRAGDGHGAIRAMAGVAEFLARHGDGDQLTEVLEQGRTYADTPALRAAYELSRGSVAFYAGSPEEAIDAFRAGRTAAEEADDRRMSAWLDSWLGTALRYAGQAAAALEPLERASTLPVTDQASREIVVDSVCEAGIAACYLGDAAKAEKAAARIETLLREEDPPLSWARLADLRTLIALLQRDYPRALEEAERGIVCYVNSSYQGNVGYLRNIRRLVLLAQGQANEAASEFIAVRKGAAELRITRLEGFAALNLAWAQLSHDNRQAATATARQAADLLAASRARETESAQALAAACDAGEASATLQGLRLAVSASQGNPDLYQPSDTVLADLATSHTRS